VRRHASYETESELLVEKRSLSATDYQHGSLRLAAMAKHILDVVKIPDLSVLMAPSLSGSPHAQ